MHTPNRDRRYRPELRERARDLYAELGTLRAVAREMGLSHQRVAKLLDEIGVVRKPSGRPPQNKEKP